MICLCTAILVLHVIIFCHKLLHIAFFSLLFSFLLFLFVFICVYVLYCYHEFVNKDLYTQDSSVTKISAIPHGHIRTAVARSGSASRRSEKWEADSLVSVTVDGLSDPSTASS